jgi:Branched-chain amino acid transport protein (AzlD)
MARTMSAATSWTIVIVTSVVCLTIKLFGHNVPERWIANARLQRINALIPIALLSALVVAQGVVTKTHLVIDHRLAGLAVAFAALLAKAPFPIVVISAAVTSALMYHLH